MSTSTLISEYNTRLFKRGLRRDIHLSRFAWLQQTVQRLNLAPTNVIELGCFDGKALNFLPSLPTRYVGIDANWEGGLDIAKENFSDYEFLECTNPKEIEVAGTFDVGICQETLEHIHPETVPEYLQKFSSLINGHFLITVPNEIGMVFFFKHFYKLFSRTNKHYTFKEFIWETLGKTDKVERGLMSHKGFNYNTIIDQVSDHFEILHVEGIPFNLLPTSLGFNVGIIGKSK